MTVSALAASPLLSFPLSLFSPFLLTVEQPNNPRHCSISFMTGPNKCLFLTPSLFADKGKEAVKGSSVRLLSSIPVSPWRVELETI